MITVACAVAAGYGTYLVYTAMAVGWDGWGPGPRRPRQRQPSRHRCRDWMVQAGLVDVPVRQFALVAATMFAGAAAVAYGVFGGVLPALGAGLFAATFPPAAYRNRRAARRDRARDAWPRLIEEVRLQTGAMGRSIPQALVEVGRRAPTELQAAFAGAQREWLLTTDFERTVAVLKAGLADPTADAVGETLLVAHGLGGAALDRRLAALAHDRAVDAQARKDARAKQAGVRFARSFVLLVPAGMAIAGMTVGDGRRAYATPGGQVAVAVALAVIAACWAWSGRMMRIPEERRVFAG